ncbi:hypothetical protein AMK26_10310 [Streptomyces sp. CB03234]|uniref:hypothetical protein n=1 Tax=Streptomyces sp. (strain CB03234) TaxID=1703937 RepID=UPI00093D9027|nr:hypothetical protein [Streptomyces sp. CB03234]OKK06410.1 hypothetical protein AMK26_10310 [Streptomyces sp. CB03234]
MSQPVPAVGRIVHYVSYGTPGGEYGKACRAAIITGVPPAGVGGEDRETLQLAVLSPTGMHFNTAYHDEGDETPGAPDCPSPDSHGAPLRYCSCGWAEGERAGGTWHWPERV